MSQLAQWDHGCIAVTPSRERGEQSLRKGIAMLRVWQSCSSRLLLFKDLVDQENPEFPVGHFRN